MTAAAKQAAAMRADRPPTIACPKARASRPPTLERQVARAPTPAIAPKTIPSTTAPEASNGIWLGVADGDRVGDVGERADQGDRDEDAGRGDRDRADDGGPPGRARSVAAPRRVGSRRRSVISGERSRAATIGRLTGGLPMRIAQLAPTFERVPPRTYGGHRAHRGPGHRGARRPRPRGDPVRDRRLADPARLRSVTPSRSGTAHGRPTG